LEFHVVQEQCEKQTKELAKLHYLLKKLKEVTTKGVDLSAYNVDLPINGEEFSQINKLVQVVYFG
jgi:hypothetical protein